MKVRFIFYTVLALAAGAGIYLLQERGNNQPRVEIKRKRHAGDRWASRRRDAKGRDRLALEAQPITKSCFVSCGPNPSFWLRAEPSD